jgi:hypothetical protein
MMDQAVDVNALEVAPTSGRLLVKWTSDGCLLAGVLHLPPMLTIQEGARYSLRIGKDRSIRVANTVMPELDLVGFQQVAPFGVDAMLGAKIWQEPEASDSQTVRFLKAFEPNGWVVFGASSRTLLDVALADRNKCAWLDVLDGRAAAPAADSKPPAMEARTMGQALRSLVAWPDAQGVLHTLPIQISKYRAHYLRKAELEARLGSNSIGVQEFMATVRADPKLMEIYPPALPEPSYLEFITAISNIGGLEIERPLTRAEFRNKTNMYNLAFRTVSQARVDRRLRPRG